MAAVPVVGTALPQQHGVAWLPPSSEPRTLQSAVKNTAATISGTPMIVTIMGAVAGMLVTLAVLMYLYWRFLRQPKSPSTGQYTMEGGSRGARHGSEGMVAAAESRPPLMQGAEHIPTAFPVVVIEPDKTIKIAVEDPGTNLRHVAGSGAMHASSPRMPLPVATVVEQDQYASQTAGQEAGPQPVGDYNNQQEGLGLQEGGRQQQPQRGEQQQHEQQREQQGRHHPGHQQQQPRLAPVIAPRQLPSVTAGWCDDGELCVAYEEQERRRREQQAAPLARSFNRVPIFPGWS